MASGMIIPNKDTVRTITPTTNYVSSGTIECKRVGNVVQVYFRGVIFTQNGSNMQIASGLPKAALQQGVVFSSVYLSEDESVWIADNTGNLYANISGYTVAHWGGMTYITTDD